MPVLAATVVLSSLGLLVSAWAGAVPKPPPKFWSVSRCERVLTRDYGFPTAEGHRFHADHVVCVGTGGQHACKWTSDHRSRLHSEFRVFGRSRYIGSIVRSWTLATRRGHGLVGIQHPAGGQVRGPRGGPPDFYVSPISVRLLATSSTPAIFRSIVAPIAARITQQENATGCTGRG